MTIPTPFSVEHAHESSGFLLWQVTTLWQRKITAALQPYDVTHTQFVLLASTLWLAQSEENITQIRLAKHAKLDIMMTSQVLRTLETKGWITRAEHPFDSRAKTIVLTDAGRELAKIIIPVVEQVDVRFFSQQTLDKNTFNQALQELSRQENE